MSRTVILTSHNDYVLVYGGSGDDGIPLCNRFSKLKQTKTYENAQEDVKLFWLRPTIIAKTIWMPPFCLCCYLSPNFVLNLSSSN